jgi:hypothetical protein
MNKTRLEKAQVLYRTLAFVAVAVTIQDVPQELAASGDDVSFFVGNYGSPSVALSKEAKKKFSECQRGLAKHENAEHKRMLTAWSSHIGFCRRRKLLSFVLADNIVLQHAIQYHDRNFTFKGFLSSPISSVLIIFVRFNDR